MVGGLRAGGGSIDPIDAHWICGRLTAESYLPEGENIGIGAKGEMAKEMREKQVRFP
jgi:hypothetical protein